MIMDDARFYIGNFDQKLYLKLFGEITLHNVLPFKTIFVFFRFFYFYSYYCGLFGSQLFRFYQFGGYNSNWIIV